MNTLAIVVIIGGGLLIMYAMKNKSPAAISGREVQESTSGGLRAYRAAPRH